MGHVNEALLGTGSSLDTPRDMLVRNHTVELATRDFGGSGPALLLIHGLGRNLEDWRPIVPALASSHRVIAMDLRGHGHSGDGNWTLSTALDDVHAVVESYELSTVVLMGHSIGGMISALYGASNNRCRAAINLDGHGRGREDQYIGFDPDQVRKHWAELKSTIGTTLPGGGAPLDLEQVDALRQTIIDRAHSTGREPDSALAVLDRSLELEGEGRYRARPNLTCVRAVLSALHQMQLFDVYRRVRCPLLIFHAVRLSDIADPPWIPAFIGSYHEGLRRDLAALSLECSHVSVETIEATHALVVERPAEIAARVEAFLLETPAP